MHYRGNYTEYLSQIFYWNTLSYHYIILMTLIQYKSIDSDTHHEISKIKWSRFIWHAFFVADKKQAETLIKEYKKKYIDATHNCRAYRVWPQLHYDLFDQPHIDAAITRSSDDGEPSWTAWRPIQKVLEWESLHNTLIIVTRYFWWTMLGVWWLVQAYTESAKAVLDHSKYIYQDFYDQVTITFNYDDTSYAMHLVESNSAIILSQKYDSQTTVTIKINTWLTAIFIKTCLDSWKIAVMST